MGGPTSDPESERMNGSMLVVEAESAAAVRAVVERDVYWASNVVSPPTPFFFFVVSVVNDCGDPLTFLGRGYIYIVG